MLLSDKPPTWTFCKPGMLAMAPWRLARLMTFCCGGLDKGEGVAVALGEGEANWLLWFFGEGDWARNCWFFGDGDAKWGLPGLDEGSGVYSEGDVVPGAAGDEFSLSIRDIVELGLGFSAQGVPVKHKCVITKWIRRQVPIETEY